MKATQNNQTITSRPSSELPQLRHPGKILIIIIVLSTLTILITWLVIKEIASNNTTKYSIHQTPTTLEKIYTVKEAVEILKNNPNFFNNKNIKLQAVVASMTKGIGCNDYMILMDTEEAEEHNRLMDVYFNSLPISPKKEVELRQEINSLISLKTGPSLQMDQTIFPTSHGIYQGHFNDPSLVQQCENGNQRFVIDSKEKEIISDNEATYKTKTINTGLIIANGKYIAKPYEVTLQDYTVKVNGLLYEPSTLDQVNKITKDTDTERQQQWDNLATALQNNSLILYGGNKYETSISQVNYVPSIINDIDALMKSNQSQSQKRIELIKLFDTSIDDSAINDILSNWSR